MQITFGCHGISPHIWLFKAWFHSGLEVGLDSWAQVALKYWDCRCLLLHQTLHHVFQKQLPPLQPPSVSGPVWQSTVGSSEQSLVVVSLLV